MITQLEPSDIKRITAARSRCTKDGKYEGQLVSKDEKYVVGIKVVDNAKADYFLGKMLNLIQDTECTKDQFVAATGFEITTLYCNDRNPVASTIKELRNMLNELTHTIDDMERDISNVR